MKFLILENYLIKPRLKKQVPYISYSAGTKPGALNKYAVKVMQELEIDISSHSSKHLDSLKGLEFDVVVTVCDSANEACPLFLGKTKKFHKSFEDPPKLTENLNNEEDILNVYRKIRDEIKNFVINIDKFI
jgi:arsenate reductase (thioredoxin)